jgi:hypothetical protein
MSEKLDVKNLKEVIDAAFESIKVYKDLAADGLDWSDAIQLGSKLINDEAFRSVYSKAIEGIDKLDDEAKDIDLAEAGELITYIIAKVQQLGKK